MLQKTSTNGALHHFILCYPELIWKVARYTSAGPVYFEPLDHYVDGGVRANNPSNYALTRIQEFLDKQAEASGKVSEYRIGEFEGVIQLKFKQLCTI